MNLDEAVTQFWSKVEMGTADACWEWLGKRNRTGYGSLSYNHVGIRAHRLAWIFTNGFITRGMNILHKCDNTGCVNPAHLFMGTQRQNISDMVAKGRAARQLGSKHGKSKLTEADVSAIRQALAGGESREALAARFGVTASAIRSIVIGRTWSHLA